MPTGPISTWSNEDKIEETIRRSKKYLGPAVGQQVDALLEPANLAILSGTLVIWAGSHFFGVGEVVDVALLLGGAAMLGPAIVDVAENLITFGKCINAQSDPELDVCAKAFADAAVKGGITVLMAVLLHRGAKAMQATRPAGASWLEVAKPRGTIGLPYVGTDPQPGTWWSRIPAVADATLPAGEGGTTMFGEIRYSAQGSATEQELVLLHETVHKFFSPRLGFLRTFRAQLKWSAYTRSAILRYLEEAMAETYAQLRVVGFKGVLTGIRFPLSSAYQISISQLVGEGEAIGTIVVGTQRFTVSILNSQRHAPASPPPVRHRIIRGRQHTVLGGFSVKLLPGSSLSAIAKAHYGDPELWPLIYDANKEKIGPNPDLVKAGTHLLLLPIGRYSASELADARKRARKGKSLPR